MADGVTSDEGVAVVGAGAVAEPAGDAASLVLAAADTVGNEASSVEVVPDGGSLGVGSAVSRGGRGRRGAPR